MVNKREMRARISRGRREHIERTRLERISSFLASNASIFQISMDMELSVNEIKRLVRKLQKINEMPRTLASKLKKEAG